MKILGINLFLFHLIALNGRIELMHYLNMGMKICSFLITISVCFLAYKFQALEYFRADAIIDKSAITSFYSITFIFLLVDIVYGKYKSFNLLLLGLLLGTDVVIVNSKISLFLFGVSFLLLYLIGDIKVKAYLKKIIIGGLIIILILITAFPDLVIPDDLKYSINKITGYDLFTDFVRSEERMDATYNIRGDLWNFCINKLFFSNPMLGIGIGEFEDYTKHGPMSIRELTETESSMLSIITEGGLLYFSLMICLFFSTIRGAYKKLTSYKTPENLTLFLFFVVYPIMMIGNDFLDSLYWIQMGIMVNFLYSPTSRMDRRTVSKSGQ